MKKWLLGGAAAVVVALVGVGVAWYLHVKHAERDIRGSSTVEFVSTEVPAPKPEEPGVAWPMYGNEQERVRVASGSSLAPPFRRAWIFHAQSLVEFPPVIAYGRLFFANNSGILFAISAKTGKRAWRYKSDRCQAMSPAVGFHTVYATFLNHPPCNAQGKKHQGQLVAFWAGSGKVRWRKTIGPSESSPLLHGKVVYVGDWNGDVYAYSATTGRHWWTFHAQGKVKDGLAYSGGMVFFGSYDHHVYAVNAVTGKLVWKAKAQQRFGHQGTFYSTPAVAYGRVYIGSTDGKVYSFGAASGKLRWSQSTGGYVYASPAIWRKRVYAGSYNGEFFCFDAATGDVKWKFKANGPISGSATIVAGRVYFATLKGRTYALNALTGHPLWKYPDGKYSPVVADKDRLYLVGYARVYGLERRRAVRSGGAVRRHRSGRVHRVAPHRSTAKRRS